MRRCSVCWNDKENTEYGVTASGKQRASCKVCWERNQKERLRKKYSCSVCGEKFRLVKEMEAHRRNDHTQEERQRVKSSASSWFATERILDGSNTWGKSKKYYPFRSKWS